MLGSSFNEIGTDSVSWGASGSVEGGTGKGGGAGKGAGAAEGLAARIGGKLDVGYRQEDTDQVHTNYDLAHAHLLDKAGEFESQANELYHSGQISNPKAYVAQEFADYMGNLNATAMEQAGIKKGEDADNNVFSRTSREMEREQQAQQPLNDFETMLTSASALQGYSGYIGNNGSTLAQRPGPEPPQPVRGKTAPDPYLAAMFNEEPKEERPSFDSEPSRTRADDKPYQPKSGWYDLPPGIDFKDHNN
jgi:hypothetical protein